MKSSEASAFPALDDEAISVVAKLGDAVRFEPNQLLIQQGEKGYPFFAITSGSVRIVETCDDQETFIVNHGPGEFTGDVDMLTGRAAVISAIANDNVSAYRLCAKRLRKLLCECPRMSETLLEAFQVRRKLLANSNFVGLCIEGLSNTAETNRLQEFLYKNHVPYTFHETPENRLPVVHCRGHTIQNPSLPKLAECIGISRNVDGMELDLVIVGAGPAGLAAAVYATSEGINTLVIDSVGPGGQAGSSSKIENFIGFPSGVSGSELANRAYLQALKFGCQFIAPICVESIETESSGKHRLKLSTGQSVLARCVLIASGVSYRQLGVNDCQKFIGAGLYYAATSAEARVCEGATTIVIGGGNSAGQAAMFLAETSKHVKVLIRGDDLNKSMSSYLVKRLQKHERIEVITNSEITAIHGDRCVEGIAIRQHLTGEVTTLDCKAIFCFIGAQPQSDWIPSDVLRDEKGYIQTGASIPADYLKQHWKLERPPCDLETTIPGIMAAGDVRSGSTKRCGFAVGDGSLAITCVHRYLATMS